MYPKKRKWIRGLTIGKQVDVVVNAQDDGELIRRLRLCALPTKALGASQDLVADAGAVHGEPSKLDENIRYQIRRGKQRPSGPDEERLFRNIHLVRLLGLQMYDSLKKLPASQSATNKKCVVPDVVRSSDYIATEGGPDRPVSPAQSISLLPGTTAYSAALLELLAGLEDVLQALPEEDSIHVCGFALRHVLHKRPDDILAFAHEKLHTFPYKEVPECWRRLYEEASLWKAVELMQAEWQRETKIVTRPLKRKRDSDPTTTNRVRALSNDFAKQQTAQPDWIAATVYVLDMAIILAGAPRRRRLIEHVFVALGHFLPLQESEPRNSLAVVPRSFPVSESLPKVIKTIRQTTKLDFVDFQKHINSSATPLIITGMLDDWPAVADPEHSWADPRYLVRCTLNGQRLVPVELGRSYTDEGWSQKIITFATYMNRYLLQSSPDQIGYLAQHDLFDQIPCLEADTITPDYCYTTPPVATGSGLVAQPTLDEPLRNAWLGPRGTISPLHTDPYHNILCQVVGYKYIRLYAPSETPKLYPRGVDEAGVNMENTSLVDVALARQLYGCTDAGSGDAETARQRAQFEMQFPCFKDARFTEGILGPGEALYIPVGVWHYIESLSTSFSMSFWWN